MTAAVSKLNSFHSASQAQLRVLNSSVRSKQEMHSGRHMNSPTMMRSAVTARRTLPTERKGTLEVKDFLGAQSIGKFTVTEKVSPAKLLREKLNEATTLPKESAQVTFLESCLAAKIEPPTAGSGDGLTTEKIVSEAPSQRIHITTQIARFQIAQNATSLTPHKLLKAEAAQLSEKVRAMKVAEGIDPEMTFEHMMHNKFVQKAIKEAVSKPLTKPASSSEIEKTNAVNLPTSSIKPVDYSIKASDMEKQESLNKYQTFMSKLKASPDGFYEVPEGFIFLMTDIKGSTKRFNEGLSNADSFAPTVGAERSFHAEKVGPRVASIALETGARIVNEVAAQFTSSLEEAKELSSLMMNALFSPGDGANALMPSGVDWPAAINVAQQRFKEAKMDCRFLVYQSGGDVQVEVRRVNGKPTIRTVVTKKLDAQLKAQEAEFSIPTAETTSSQSSSTQLAPPRVSQGIYMIPSSHLTFAAVFKTANKEQLTTLQAKLTEMGLSEKQTCNLLNNFCSNQKDFNLEAVQGFQNIEEGNFFVCIPNAMLPTIKEVFTTTLGDKHCDVTVGRQFHAASVIDPETGKHISTVIGSGALTKAAEIGKIRDFRQCINEVVQNLSQHVDSESLYRLIDTHIPWNLNKAFDVAAMTEKITKYYNQEFLIMAPKGLVTATN